MKKIGNWIFGSMFRTFGRILAFILIGALIGSIISYGGILEWLRNLIKQFIEISPSLLL